MNTLVEATDHLEGSPPALGSEGHKEVIFQKCGEIFTQEGYKVIVEGLAAQRPTQEREEGKEVPTVEQLEENEPGIDIIPDQDL